MALIVTQSADSMNGVRGTSVEMVCTLCPPERGCLSFLPDAEFREWDRVQWLLHDMLLIFGERCCPHAAALYPSFLPQVAKIEASPLSEEARIATLLKLFCV